jgi:DDE superfamily endonuclease
MQIIMHWLKHVRKLRITGNVLLLLDGSSTHTSFEALAYAKENTAILCTFPANCTHEMQIFDVGIFGPMKSQFRTMLRDEVTDSEGEIVATIDREKIVIAFCKSYAAACTAANVASAWAATGIRPFNPHIFDSKFAASNMLSASSGRFPCCLSFEFAAFCFTYVFVLSMLCWCID